MLKKFILPDTRSTSVVKRKYKVRYGYVRPEDVSLVKHADCKPNLRKLLLPSLRDRGQLNPVILWSTKGELRICYGISRCKLLQELDREIMAVIADYDKRWEHLPELHNEDEIAELFANPESIKPLIQMGSTKLYLTHHARVEVDEEGNHF